MSSVWRKWLQCVLLFAALCLQTIIVQRIKNQQSEKCNINIELKHTGLNDPRQPQSLNEESKADHSKLMVSKEENEKEKEKEKEYFFWKDPIRWDCVWYPRLPHVNVNNHDGDNGILSHLEVMLHRRGRNCKSEDIQLKGRIPFSMAFLRDPNDRALSAFIAQQQKRYFARRPIDSIKNGTNSMMPPLMSKSENFREFLLNNFPENDMTTHLSKSLAPDPLRERDKQLPLRRLYSLLKRIQNRRENHKVLDPKTLLTSKIQFVGIYERLEESLIVLRLLLGLSWRDILLLPINDLFIPFPSTGKSNSEGRCIFVTSPAVPSSMLEWLKKDPKWKSKTGMDRQLYVMANEILDNTIEQLGSNLIAQQLDTFHRLLDFAELKCHNKATSPCTINGDWTPMHTCATEREHDKPLGNGGGCGYDCLDKINLNSVLLEAAKAETGILSL